MAGGVRDLEVVVLTAGAAVLFCLVREAIGELVGVVFSSLSVSKSTKVGNLGAGADGRLVLEMGSRMSARTLLSCS